MRNLVRGLIAALLLAVLPVASQAGVFVSVTIAPPPLPVYELPPFPGPGFVWTPGYWAWDGVEYYWVPGTWVLAPVGLLWTPGYWGWSGGVFVWNAGYWGPHVGFYGGVDYGFGYPGEGYRGGEWRGNEFVVNRAVMNNVTINRVSYNGGQGGIVARPSREDMVAAREHHQGPLETQRGHEEMASHDRRMCASVNGGRPAIAATGRPGVFSGRGVVAARNSASGGFRAGDRSSFAQPGGSARAPEAARGGRAPSGETHGGPYPQTRGNSFESPRGGASEQPRSRVEQPRGFQPQPQRTQPQREQPRGGFQPQHPQPQPHEQPRGGFQPQQTQPQPREQRPQQEQRPQREERQQRDDHPHQARAFQARPQQLMAQAPQPRPARPAPQLRPERAAPAEQRMARAPQDRPQRGERGDHRHG